MDYQMIATPIVGAMIGYTTNWVAIKMLFRPYVEKRVLGVKIPFTPGLIPKERDRIANAIGGVVEQYLLTDEVIVSELTSETMSQNIVSIFEKELRLNEGFFDISGLLQGQDDSLLEDFCKMLSDRFFEEFTKDETVTHLSAILKEKIIEFLNQKDIRVLASENEVILSEFLEGLCRQENVEQLAIAIEGFIEQEKPILELMGVEIFDQIKEILTLNEYKMKEAILGLMHGEAFSNEAKAMITNVISNKFGALGAMFVNSDSIYESITEVVKEKLELTQISEVVSSYLAVGLSKPLNEFIPEATQKSLSLQIAQKILSTKTKQKVEEILLKMDQTPYEWINKMTSGKGEYLVNQMIQVVILELSKNRKQLQSGLTNKVIGSIKSLISAPLKISEMMSQKIRSKITDGYQLIIKKYVVKIIKTAKLSAIVEKQINTFEVKMLEEVILSIAKKELSAITWLGALLGFIMSIILLMIK